MAAPAAHRNRDPSPCDSPAPRIVSTCSSTRVQRLQPQPPRHARPRRHAFHQRPHDPLDATAHLPCPLNMTHPAIGGCAGRARTHRLRSCSATNPWQCCDRCCLPTARPMWMTRRRRWRSGRRRSGRRSSGRLSHSLPRSTVESRARGRAARAVMGGPSRPQARGWDGPRARARCCP